MRMSFVYGTGVFFIIGLILCYFFPLHAETGVSLQKDRIVFENMYMKYEVGTDALVKGLYDKKSNINYLDQTVKQPLMYARLDGKDLPATSAEYALDGDLYVRFGENAVEVCVKVDIKQEYISFEVKHVNNTDVEQLTLSDLHLTITEKIGTALNVAWNRDFCVGVLALSMNTNANGKSNDKAILFAEAVSQFGFTGAKYALAGAPTNLFLSIVEQIELENGLPHLMLGGAWNKVSPEVEKSYFFVDLTERNADEIMKYAKDGGFSYILIYRNIWAKQDGHYEINTENFPHGIEGLKSVVQKFHKEGIKVGIHTLVGWIGYQDPYVTPVPDARLAVKAIRVLSEDVDEKADFIPLLISPEGFSEKSNIRAPGGLSVQIDNEIITYSKLKKTPPFGLTGCKRGVHGTKPSSHVKGTKVNHLVEAYRHFIVDDKGGLLYEVAQRLADVVNQCEMDMIYFDGINQMRAVGPHWYYTYLMLYEVISRINREVMVEGAGMPHLGWHLFTRQVGGDYVAMGVNKYIDDVIVPRAVNFSGASFMPAELGWYGIINHAKDVYATLPEDLEYVMGKCIGYGAAISLETHQDVLEGNGRITEILNIMRDYEKLRLEGYFSGKEINALKILGQEYKMIKKENGEIRIHPIKIKPVHFVESKNGENSEFTIDNPYGIQPVKLRLRAMWTPAEYDGPDNIVLTDFSEIDRSKIEVSKGLLMGVSNASDMAKDGNKSLKITVNNKENLPGGWCRYMYTFDEPVNLINNRSLGFWVYGDGSGALLNIHFEDDKEFPRDHYVDIDFSGWKYCEILLPEGERVWDYPWPYSPKTAARYLDYDRTKEVSIYVNNIPANGNVTLYITQVKALKEHKTAIANPKIVIGGNSIVFPVILKEDEYIELSGDGKCIHYDPFGFTLKNFQSQGVLPNISAGANTVTFSCDGKENERYIVGLNVITLGEPVYK